MARLHETSQGKTELHNIAKEKTCSEDHQQLKGIGIALCLLSVTLQIKKILIQPLFSMLGFPIICQQIVLFRPLFRPCFVVSCAILFDVQCSGSYRV